MHGSMKSLLALLLPAIIFGQDPQFEAQSRLVMLPVMVTDNKGRPIEGLEEGDFLVLDNGRKQKVVVDTFGTGVAPIALVIAVQASGISAPVLDKVRQIAAMIQPLITGDRGCAAVVSFSEEITWQQECTNDHTLITRALTRITTGEPKSARMLDASMESINKLRERPRSRRVLLLISETRDRGSEATIEQVTIAAQTNSVTVYAAPYSAFMTAFTERSRTNSERDNPQAPRKPTANPGDPEGRERYPVPPTSQRVDILGGFEELGRLKDPKTAEILATATGGALFGFTKKSGLEEAITKLADELNAQYVLSFTPELAAPGYHRLEVRLTRPGKFKLRARPGYWPIL